MEGRIARYFPSVFKQAAEFQALACAEEIEINRLWTASEKLLNAQFVLDADETGLRRWEKLLKLKGKGSLETRRAAILLKLNDKLPYTMRWLKNKLDVALEGKEHGTQIDGYFLTIYSDETGIEILKAMREDIRLNVPANLALIWLIRSLPYTVCTTVKIRPRLMVKTFYSVRHRYEALVLDGSWELDGKYSLDGLKTTIRQDYYPASAEIKAILGAKPAVWLTGRVQAKAASHAAIRLALQAKYPLKAQGFVGARAGACSVFPVNASVKARAVMDKDLWYLDGQETLDGARILDAEVIRKEL